MNDMSETFDPTEFMDDGQKKIYRMFNGMMPAEAAYMRGDKKPVETSVPVTTSKYLNSPLFRDAFTTMSLRRSGGDVAVTYDIPDLSRGVADVTDFVENSRIIETEKSQNPAFAEWVDARKPIEFDSERLAAAAPGTLGHKIHDFLTSSGMNMKFTRNEEAGTDLEFVTKSVAHTHDLSHIISGFGPNMAGEVANNFMAITANYKFFSPEAAKAISFTTSIASTIPLNRVLLHYPEAASIILEATRRGIEAGQGLKVPIFMVDYNHYLDWQLDDAAADLGFVRGPDEEWDFSEALCHD